jgi:uncharacterized membrane protein YuzA (DUF378 family)
VHRQQDDEPERRSDLAGKKACFVDYLALILLVVGGVNWGIMGILEKDLVMGVLGFSWDIARIIYIVVGAAGLWGLFATLGRLK